MSQRAITFLAAIVAIIGSSGVQGAPVGEPGPELWVDGPLDTVVGGAPISPDAAADHRGQQVYVWEDVPSGDDSGIDVFMRVFGRGGDSLLGPVKVNTTEADNQRYGKVAIAPDGTFLVIWQSFEPVAPGVFHANIRSRAFDSNGQPLGPEQMLSTVDTGLQTEAHADVAALTGGAYVAVWENYSPDSGDYSIQGRMVGADGVPTGSQFQVNSLVTGTVEQYPSATGLADGGFLATWSAPQIQARRFMSDGTPVGNDFQVNTFVGVSFRWQPNVATNDDGRVLVVWADDEDGNGTEIRGRLYSPTLNPMGPDFRINTYVTGAQTVPQVAGYGGAGFFVIWQSFGSSGPDPDPTSIEGRIVTGVDAFAGPQFLVNQYTANEQLDPGIGGAGGYVAMAWMSRQNEFVMGQVILGQFWNICGIFCNGFE